MSDDVIFVRHPLCDQIALLLDVGPHNRKYKVRVDPVVALPLLLRHGKKKLLPHLHQDGTELGRHQPPSTLNPDEPVRDERKRSRPADT